MGQSSVILLSESRGEFLLVERMRAALGRRGISTRHIAALGNDLSKAERTETAGLYVLDDQPEYQRAADLSGPELATAVEREQRALGANLRRLWQADLRSWREGYSDDEMARIALGYLASLRRILTDIAPVGLWGEDGGHLIKQLGYVLCAQLDVPLWFLWAIPLPGRIVPYSDVLVGNDAAEFARFEASAEELTYARDLVNDLRSTRINYAFPRNMTMRPQRLANFARLLHHRYVTKPAGAESLYPFRFAQLYLRQRAATIPLRRMYQEVGERPFVFYPVHVAHDTQVTVRGHQWENQLSLIEHIASALPYGYDLAIKEHPAQVGALPILELKGLLRRHRNIKLLDASLHAHAIIQQCVAVATINSTTGFEALVFGTPVVTFGHSPYRSLGLTHDVHDPFDTPALLLRATETGGAAEDDVVRYIAFLYRRSSPGFPLSDDGGNPNVEHYADYLAERFGQSLAE